jgi:hypothetical protein
VRREGGRGGGRAHSVSEHNAHTACRYLSLCIYVASLRVHAVMPRSLSLSLCLCRGPTRTQACRPRPLGAAVCRSSPSTRRFQHRAPARAPRPHAPPWPSHGLCADRISTARPLRTPTHPPTTHSACAFRRRQHAQSSFSLSLSLPLSVALSLASREALAAPVLTCLYEDGQSAVLRRVAPLELPRRVVGPHLHFHRGHINVAAMEVDPDNDDILATLRQGFVAQERSGTCTRHTHTHTTHMSVLWWSDVGWGACAAAMERLSRDGGQRKCGRCSKLLPIEEFRGRRCCIPCLGRAAIARAHKRALGTRPCVPSPHTA